MKILRTPISEDDIEKLEIGETVYISGDIFCGRDAVLPIIVELVNSNAINEIGVDLNGGLIFHTAVSIAGIGPTSSNKAEIEASIIPLSKAGIRIHLGKGKISHKTVEEMALYDSVYAVVPPVSALLGKVVKEKEIVCFPELGMEAFYKLKVDEMPIVIAAIGGRYIYG